MTAVNWLIDQIKNDQNQKALSANEWSEIFEQAKEMEKQQIGDALYTYSDETICDSLIEHYYNKTFGSDELSKVAENTSFDHIVDTNEMIKKSEWLLDELNKNK